MIQNEILTINRYALAGGDLDEATLFEALRSPVPRLVFDVAVAEVCEARRARVSGGGGEGAEVTDSRGPGGEEGRYCYCRVLCQ